MKARAGARAVVVCVGICLLATACRAPGEPPTHPDVGVYRDIIRRESDSTHTALATARLLVTTARARVFREPTRASRCEAPSATSTTS